MKRCCLTVLLLVVFHFHLEAIPAYPRKIMKDINGIEMPVKLYGDEFSKRIETIEGHTIIQNDNGVWVYAALNEIGELIPSTYLVGDKSSESANFISTLPIHLAKNSQVVKSVTYQAPRQPAIGQRRMLIILMEFPDNKFIKSKQDFDNLFNQVDYDEDGAQGSVRDYFYRSSYGQLVLSCDVYGPYQTVNRMSSYGRNTVLGGGDKDPAALFIEAIESVSEEVDLGVYDGDNDGYVDNVHIIYAGYGEEAGGASNTIWAHESTFPVPYEIQGLKIDRYSCASELRGNSGEGISRIGPHCHEIGHALGAMDYYDTNYSDGGLYDGTGMWDVMAVGSWNNDGITPADFNPYVKSFCYGWVDVHALPNGIVIIPPSDMDKDSYYFLSNGTESYIIENRNPQLFNEGLPGKGLLLFHVHSDIEKVENEINVSNPQHCYVVCASSNKDIPRNSYSEYGDINSDGCPFPGSCNKEEFSIVSIPAAFWWNGDECNISLHDIELLQNGYIRLYNNSHESDYFRPIDEELYFDGFETQKQYSIKSLGQSSWERVKSSGMVDMVAGKPSPYEGEYSLQLSARNKRDASVSTFYITSSPRVDATSVLLSGYFISKGLNKGQVNSLKIGWHFKGSNNWEYYDYDVPVNDIWTPFSLRFPSSSDLEISLEGTAQGGSVLAMDNIKLEQRLSTGISIVQLKGAIMDGEIISISGRKAKSLSKGLNIIRNNNGRIKKIWVK